MWSSLKGSQLKLFPLQDSKHKEEEEEDDMEENEPEDLSDPGDTFDLEEEATKYCNPDWPSLGASLSKSYRAPRRFRLPSPATGF